MKDKGELRESGDGWDGKWIVVGGFGGWCLNQRGVLSPGATAKPLVDIANFSDNENFKKELSEYFEKDSIFFRRFRLFLIL